MKLNPDCVRDILLSIEESVENDGLTFLTNAHFRDAYPRLEKYTVTELEYHLRQCNLSGFFVGFEYFQIDWRLDDLSPKAHNFLANIRKDSTWNGVKSIAGKIGSKSLDALVEIASNVITELIKAQFGL